MEIRLADSQECPMADIAVPRCSLCTKIPRKQPMDKLEGARSMAVGPLLSILERTISSG